MKLISVVTPCFNEEENIEEIYRQVRNVFLELDNYNYEHIFIDNCSQDKTVEILKKIAEKDKNVKIIVNTRNFGHIRSPYYGLLQTSGDAAISIVADLQDPPRLILDFIKKWEEGYKIVVGIKTKSTENFIMKSVRRLFYKFITKMSETKLLENYTGFGLYDKKIIDILRELKDPYPYFRGIISDIGYDIATIEYIQPSRFRGKTKNNFFTLYDMAIIGIVSYSKYVLRLVTIIGFCLSCISLLIALFYFIYKIIFWDKFSVGIAPLVIGLFFFSSIQIFLIGFIGEYIEVILTKIQNRPLVIEKERINF
jgi:glycosyltransferase involved in cell wall biosynthesis